MPVFKLEFYKELQKKWIDTTIMIQKDCLSPPIRCKILAANPDVMHQEIGPIKNKLSLSVQLDGEEAVVDIILSDYIINLNIIDVGYVNYGYTCSYISRTCKKQWKRGECKGTTDRDLYTGGFNIDKDLGAPSHDYPSLADIVPRIISGASVAVAFSSHYAIGVNKYSDKLFVLYKNTSIGVLSKGEEGYSFSLPKKVSHFLEDLSQYGKVELV